MAAKKLVLTKAVNNYWWNARHRAGTRKARTSMWGWSGWYDSDTPPWFAVRRARAVKRRKR